MTEKFSDNMVEIKNLSFKRGNNHIFNDINISIPKGKITAIMGPSGTGKTTLLRLIAGQLKPDKGTIVVNGLDINKISNKNLYELRKGMGMLFQQGALLTDINVFDNVAFPLRENTKLPEKLIKHIVFMKLHAVGLRGAYKLMPSELSGGMARRVALARAIALDPSLLIYDEPLNGLDPISMGVVLRLIRNLNDALGITSIIVSHDVAETATVSDWTYIIADKEIIASGTPQQINLDKSALVQQFINGIADGPVPFHFPANDYFDQMLSNVKNSEEEIMNPLSSRKKHNREKNYE